MDGVEELVKLFEVVKEDLKTREENLIRLDLEDAFAIAGYNTTRSAVGAENVIRLAKAL